MPRDPDGAVGGRGRRQRVYRLWLRCPHDAVHAVRVPPVRPHHRLHVDHRPLLQAARDAPHLVLVLGQPERRHVLEAAGGLAHDRCRRRRHPDPHGLHIHVSADRR